MKPHLHAKNSVKHFGGRLEDYISIHEFIDSSKSCHADMRHRAVLHSAFGIYVTERVFARKARDPYGNECLLPFQNSDGVLVHVRDVAERHVLEDLGKIPSLSDYLNHMELAQWIGGPVVKSRRMLTID
jgi:hypothetical protein